MNKIFFVMAIICSIVLCLSTAGSIIYGVYQWCVVDVEFKQALWAGIKTWMIVGGSSFAGTVFFAISTMLSSE